ncbi:hypothetical protein BGX21_000872, partial [Mortierella sp. AD011]
MDPQEKLEAMFCPRLDSALVASIYNDTGDFKTSISILSTLAASTPNGLDTRGSSSSAGQLPDTTTTTKNNQPSVFAKKNKKTLESNNNNNNNSNKNILIWSEQVANSNTTASSSSRSGGYKQGLVTNSSSFQQPSSPTTRSDVVLPAGSGAQTAAPLQKKTFRAARNLTYLKKNGLVDEPEQELETLSPPEDSDDGEVYEDAVVEQLHPEDDEEDHYTVQILKTGQKPQTEKKAKKNRGRKQAAKANSTSSALPPTTFQSGKWSRGTFNIGVSDQLAGLHISGQQSAEEDEDEFESCEDDEDDTQEPTDDGTLIKSEELEFLKSCFPDREHSDEYLAEVLNDSHRDLEKAVEMILSQMFLDNEQVDTSSNGSGSHYSSGSQAITSTSSTVSSLDDAFFRGTQKSKKKKRSEGHESAWGANRHLQSVWDGPTDALSKTINGQDELLIPESNEWTTFEHQISMLMNIFHTVPRATIVSEYHTNSANLFKTVDSLEKRLKDEDHYGSGPGLARQSQFDMSLAQLIEMFPDHTTVGLKKILIYNGSNIQDAMNAVLAADIAREEQSKNQQHAPSPWTSVSSSSCSSSKRSTVIPVQASISFADKNHVPNPTSNGNRLKSLPSTSNPFPGGPRPFPNTLLDSANAELYNDDDDPVWCRQRAHEVLGQRNELFRKAAQAYQAAKGKGGGMSGIAAYYADEGKKLDAEGKRWHMRAARAVVQHHRLENNNPNLVDLHGLTVSEAQTVVKEA